LKSGGSLLIFSGNAAPTELGSPAQEGEHELQR